MPAATAWTPVLSPASIPQQSFLTELSGDFATPRWFATYTSSRREKQVARELGERSVECFLPLYGSIRRRNGGKVSSLPLFPGYVFVRIALRDRLHVLQVPGVVRLVSFNGRPAALDDQEIEAIRDALSAGVRAEPYPYIKIGHEVEILKGPLQGLRGKVIRKNNRFRVVLSVDLLQRSIVADIDSVDVVAGSLPMAA